MTKRALIGSAASIAIIVVIASWLGLHYVPSPFASVKLRGDTVVAQIRPGTSFGLMRERTRIGEHIAESESVDFHDGESVMLYSAHTGYHITCRVSPRPAGLFIQGSWFLHDLLRSAEKTWFVAAH